MRIWNWIHWSTRSLGGLALIFLSIPACSMETVEIAMRDDTMLTTDIHKPKQIEPPYPIILVRSTYGRNHPGFIQPYLERGYAVVIQDVRGMGNSEGDPYVFRAEGWQPDMQDAADTVNWMLQQPWCNGNIGTVGGSALGITQMLMAPTTPEIKGQVIEVAATNFYHDISYQGGVFRKELLENWLAAIQQPHMIANYKAHPVYDEYWQYYNVVDKAPEINSPGLFIGGWYDIFQQGTIDAFLSREHNGAEGARGNNMMIMRWSSHGPDTTTDYAYPEQRNDLDVSAIQQAFLAHHILGEEEALAGIPKVHYWVHGADNDPEAPGNEWRTADTWPPLPSTEVALYLHPDGLLKKEEPSQDTAHQTFVFDPNDPFPTKGGHNLFLPMGPYDQRPDSLERTDILRFATLPLEAPLETIGRVRVVLHVSSDAPDTDFTAKLLDIYPEGDEREILIIDNIRRVKTREGYDKVAPLLTSEEEVIALEIDLWNLAWVFNTGHQIGLHISSSNYPRFEVNPNTGADFPEADIPMQKARNSVHMSSRYPSSLYLPVID